MDTMNKDETLSPNSGEIVLYHPDETIRLEVKTAWLNRQQIYV